MEKEVQPWYQRLSHQFLAFVIVIFNTALAIPYLMTNLSYVFCDDQESYGDLSDQSCFSGVKLVLFLINIVFLMVFIGFSYFYLTCLNLNFNLPVEHYLSPWATLRPQTILLHTTLHFSSSFMFIFSGNRIIVIIMQCMVFVILLLRNFFKFRQVYYLQFKVHFVDIILNSFLACFVLLSLLIAHIDLPYTYNSLYLIFFISLLFAIGMSYIHNFYRVSALEKFFGNFMQLRDDLDFSVNTIIDYLCSKNKKDNVRIKGLIQLIISQSGCDASKKRQREKIEKYKKIFKTGDKQNYNLSPDQTTQNSRIRSESVINAADSQFRVDSVIIETNKTQINLSKFRAQSKIHEQRSAFSMEVEEYKDEQQHKSHLYSGYISEQNTNMIDPGQININDQSQNLNDMTFDNFVQDYDKNQSQLIDQQEKNRQSQALSNFDNLDMYESKDEETQTLLDSQSIFHSKKDIDLILEVLDYFLLDMKQVQTKMEIYIRVLLLKIRLLYLSQKQERFHYLMYLVSCLDAHKPTFRMKVIQHIFQKKFSSVFQVKVQEKANRLTPTTLVFYEHQRECFEQSVYETTELMTSWLSDLKLQGTSTNEIQRRFIKAKEIVQMTIDLNKRFKKIINSQAQQMDLVIMYFHFLDQVVHQENEAKEVYKIMVDLSHSDKMNRRFELFQSDIRHQGSGFILVSGNQSNLGSILKMNNAVCNYLQYFKNDLINKKIEFIMPYSIAQYHDQIIQNYVLISQSVSKKNKKQQKSKKEKLQQNTLNQQYQNEEAIEGVSQAEKTKFQDQRYKNWHLNQKNHLLTFKTKQNLIVPLICDFDIYFDLSYGIQFLCLIQQPKDILFEDQKVNKKDVYIIQTNGYTMIEGISHNVMKRFGITQQKVFDERIYISQIFEGLNDLNELRFDTGSPEFLDLRIFQMIQNEESKSQMEKYHQKINIKYQKALFPSASNHDDKMNTNNDEDTRSFPQLNSFQLMMPNEYQQICYVKREVLPYSQAVLMRKQNQLGSINLENQQSVIEGKRAGIIYYLVFYNGMTQQMRECANLYYQQRFKEQLNFNNLQIGRASLNPNIKQKSLIDETIMKSSAVDEQESSKSEGQFTFGSTSSSTQSSQKDKISELKNESFLGQIPIFVKLFQKVFIFYFILFIVTSTVILVVVLNSVQDYYEIVDNVQAAKLFVSDTTAVQMIFRAYMDIANNLQDLNSTIVGDKFIFMQKKLINYSEIIRLENNDLRKRVDKSDIPEIKTLYKNEIVPVYELSQKAQVLNRNMSLDQALSVFISKIQSVVDGISQSAVFSKNNPLQCDCGLSRDMIFTKQQKGLSYKNIERDAFYVLENGNYNVLQQLYDIGESFLNYSADQVIVYKNQILILVICCVSLAFICSIAFIPYYLRMKRNLNLNIYLIEKMHLSSIYDALSNISSFTKMLSNQKGKYGGGYQNKINNEVNFGGGQRTDSQQDSYQQEPGQRIQSTVQSQKRKDPNKRLALKNQKLIQKKSSIYQNDSTSEIFKNSKLNKIKKENQDDKRIQESINTKEKQANDMTQQTYKTTENMVFRTNELEMIEEFKEINIAKLRELDKSSDDEDEYQDPKNSQKSRKHRRKGQSRGQQEDDEEDNKNGNDFREEEQQGTSDILKDKMKSLNQMYLTQKIRVIAISFTTSMILTMFFLIVYFLSAKAFDQVQDSLFKFRVFYNVQPYVVNFFQLNREQYDKNSSNFFDFNGIGSLEELYKATLALNEEIRDLKQNYPVTLEQAEGYLKQLDSSQFCSIAVPQLEGDNLSVQDCLAVGDGLFKNGFSYAMSTMMSFFYMQQIQFDKMLPSQRTKVWLNQMLNDKKSNDYILIYLKYIVHCFTLVQQSVTDSFNTYFNNRAKEVIVVYAIFVLVLMMLIFVLLYILMTRLQKEIYLARKTIQLIPHKELMKNENYEIASRIKY